MRQSHCDKIYARHHSFPERDYLNGSHILLPPFPRYWSPGLPAWHRAKRKVPDQMSQVFLQNDKQVLGLEMSIPLEPLPLTLVMCSCVYPAFCLITTKS
ncbi:unnamed protein product [Periconia digitata]|uniref:Uncharacterized protein n=1 Tax=Periconia digitata TaxID=1303443 RepID=A0A9W4XHP0_9PLEO|nr:unnamed protein product [Periconia digitata]